MHSESSYELGPNKWFAWAMTTLFFVFGILGILHHEPWRDELQPWLLGRDFQSIWSLIAHSRYEGHPCLWHLILFFTSRIWNNPLAMQILHVTIASTSIFLFLKFSPFTTLQKILFTFSYFFFYEFSIISRDYVLGLLFLTIYTILLLRPKKSYWIMSLLLVLMCNTNAMIFLIACSLGLFLFGDEFLAALKNRRWPSAKILFPYAFFIAGVIFALWQMIPKPDCALYPGIPADDNFYFSINLPRIGHILEAVVGVFLPLQDLPSSYFWSSNLLLSALEHWFTENTTYWIIASLMGLVVLIFTTCFFITRPKILRIYIIGSFVMLTFFFLVYYGGIRHVAHLVLLFIFCLWMSYKTPAGKLPPFIPSLFVKIGKFFDRHRTLLVTLFAAFQAVAGVYAYIQDWQKPFTASRAAIAYAKTLDPKLPLIGTPDYSLTAFSAYLNHPVYYLDSLRYGTYIHWDENRKVLDFPKLFKRISDFMKDHDECILILNYDFLKTIRKNGINPSTLPFLCKELNRFNETSIADEMYIFYDVRHRK